MELDSRFEKLITKKMTYNSTNLGLNLLISRLQRKYSMNQTPTELNNCIQEMKAFFTKYPLVVEKDAEALKNM